jgi:signal transduction histidine kinase
VALVKSDDLIGADRAASSSPPAAMGRVNATRDEAMQELYGHFLANITHEFRTPLAALNATVEYLADNLAQLSHTEIGELLLLVHQSVTGLQTLIDNLIESTSIDAGQFTIQSYPVEMKEIVNEAVRIMRPFINRRGQSVNVLQPATLPLIQGDPTRLTQVLVNLLSNASKFGPIGQSIFICMEETANDMVRISVADRGPGISAEERDRLFQRYWRTGTLADPWHGIGLGLSVVKAIVESHGGETGADEYPGGGSIFWFTIPTVVP